MKKITLILFGLLLNTLIFSQSHQIEGEWFNEEKDAIITIEKGSDNSYFGKITWMKFPNDENGNPKTDPLNDDENLRSRSRLGMKIMYDFVYDGEEEWDDGEIYDPKSGNTYSGTINMISKNRLNLRGYVGISWFGRTSHWTRKL
ncbi:MAG: DUF2147 domain-containing protein [Flavobacteriales bacterium]|jgi:uncharacterized protein (DUF2147 family)|nr:DUF2147 domain-containing protein [Flavobacteriales bacterium]MBT6808318.1 DUF2147 domain-containing protein [Flavobacteriales bacterium]